MTLYTPPAPVVAGTNITVSYLVNNPETHPAHPPCAGAQAADRRAPPQGPRRRDRLGRRHLRDGRVDLRQRRRGDRRGASRSTR
ncbi:hypothetical protein G5V59_00240 [Nocardioides sp. W3-2-3]|uniref:hypothetical protein n=1 Tax=Nocardioides convexus TaxID=2712224 RepID=UPI002418AF7A|nr:hypothetical protein [Nocardioides convexus]NGZ99402.1 hypothetical protein [Nocardioides convexus]